jgi:hypothetical protein
MTHTVSWIDRLRIERVVWSLDQRLYDLPRRSRIAKRREVRESLLTASLDVGTTAALHQLGDTRRLALEYLSAEFGDEARPHWMAAAVVLFTIPLVLMSLLADAATAFSDGIQAADPHAAGRYTWHGIAYLQDTVSYTFADGTVRQVGGALTPLSYLLLAVATVCAGRLWRAIPMWRRRRRSAATSAPGAARP